MGLDLIKVKERKQTVLNLKKEAGLESQKSQVVLAMDFSGSMGGLYANGTVQDTVERIMPLGLAFDDNGEVDFYLFDDHYIKVPDSITLKNCDGYINSKVIGKYNMGGTNYAPVLKAIYKDFVTKTGGLFGVGAKATTMDYPVYIIFITDGNNFDKHETEDIVRSMSEAGFFIQFVGIGNESFSFLSKLDDLSGRKIDNANFFKCPNVSRVTDDELYKLLMSEFPGWVSKAKSLNLIK
jgi:hypothetical protein